MLIGVLILIVAQFGNSKPSPSTSESTRPASSAMQTQPSIKLPTTTATQQPARAIETRYVTASSLNVRTGPNTSSGVVGKIGTGAEIAILEKRGGWLRIQTTAGDGWVSEQFTSISKSAPVYRPPAPLAQSIPAAAIGQTCSPRRTCGRISSCSAARWYLANCSWGGRLDRDNDGRPCESMC